MKTLKLDDESNLLTKNFQQNVYIWFRERPMPKSVSYWPPLPGRGGQYDTGVSNDTVVILNLQLRFGSKSFLVCSPAPR